MQSVDFVLGSISLQEKVQFSPPLYYGKVKSQNKPDQDSPRLASEHFSQVFHLTIRQVNTLLLRRHFGNPLWVLSLSHPSCFTPAVGLVSFHYSGRWWEIAHSPEHSYGWSGRWTAEWILFIGKVLSFLFCFFSTSSWVYGNMERCANSSACVRCKFTARWVTADGWHRNLLTMPP